MANLTKNEKYIVDMYVRYFGKAPSVAEIAKYKEFGKPKQILNEIIKEYNDSKPVSPTDQVNSVFQNLFGRNADQKEMNKYSKVVDAGKDLPINSIVKSAAKADKAVYNNKKAVALKNAELGGAELDLSKISKDNLIDLNTLKTVTTAADLKAKIDAIQGEVPGEVPGETFTLTTSADNKLLGTTKSDSFVGTQATYQTGDLLIDATTTDNDLFTLTTTSNTTATPTVSGIERIVINAEKAGAFAFAADNISGAKSITVNRTDLMNGAIDGKGAVSITAARATEFVAGDKVTAFSVAMDATSNIATAATVDATKATGLVTVSNINYAGTTIKGINAQNVTVSETASATSSKATIEIAGKSTVTNTVANMIDELTLNATAATEITLDKIAAAADGSLTLKGAGDITLNIASAELTAKKLVNEATGKVDLVVGPITTATDFSKVEKVSSIEIGAVTAVATGIITLANGQNIISGAQTSGINLQADKADSTVTLSVKDNKIATAVTWAKVQLGTASTETTATNVKGMFDTAIIDATNDSLIITALDAGGDSVVGNLTDGSNIILTGTKDITIGDGTNGLLNAASVISSSTGKVNITSEGNVGKNQLIATGEGNDTITLQSATTVFAVNAGNGDNLVNVTTAAVDSSVVTGKGKDNINLVGNLVYNVNTGANDDTVTIATASTAKHNINFGEGNDTLVVNGNSTAVVEFGTGSNILKSATHADLTAATLTGNVDTVEMTGTTTLAITAAQLAEFNGFALKGSDVSNVLSIDGTNNNTALVGQTIDASGVSVALGVNATLEITASGKGDTITGSNAADSIILAAGADIVKFVSTINADEVTKFDKAEDKLDFSAIVSGSAVTTVPTDKKVVTDSVYVLTGAADAAVATVATATTLIGTTNSMKSVLGDKAVFVLNGDTESYIYEFNNIGNATIEAEDFIQIGIVGQATFVALDATNIA